MSWPWAMRPNPICPTRMRLFAPQARDEMINGAATALAVTKCRRVIMATRSWGTSREYTRGPLLVAQGLDGVQPRCLACRVQPEHDADAGTHAERDEHDLGL